MKNDMNKTSRRSVSAGFTLIELLVVISIIAVLASLAFPVTQAVLKRGYAVKTAATVKDIQVAINSYITEYNRLPMTSKTEAPLPTDQGSLINTLMAEGNTDLNSRKIVFLNVNMAKGGRGGLIDNGGSLQLVDSWGNPFYVIMDTNFDNKIANPDLQSEDRGVSQNAPQSLRTRVAVFSYGPDGKQGTKDDIVSWR